MKIASRGTGKIETKYKNTFWKYLFSIKLTKKFLPKLQKEVSYKLITDYKLISCDIVK